MSSALSGHSRISGGGRGALALLLGLLASGAAWAAIEVMHEDSEKIVLQLEYEAEPLYESLDRLAKKASLVDIGAESNWLRAGEGQRKRDWLKTLGALTGRDDLNQQRCRSAQLELADWPYLQSITQQYTHTYRFLVTCAGQYALVDVGYLIFDPKQRDLFLGVRRLAATEADEHRYSRLPAARTGEEDGNLLSDQPGTLSDEEDGRRRRSQQEAPPIKKQQPDFD